MRITITIDLPGLPECAVSAPVIDVQTRPDAAPCSCRGECHPTGDWFQDQDRRERLARRKGTVMEGRDGA